MQGHCDTRIAGDHFVGELGEGDGASHPVGQALSGQVGGTSHRDLDDPVGLGLVQPLQGRVQGLGAGHIDGGIGVGPPSGRIEHRHILFRSR